MKEFKTYKKGNNLEFYETVNLNPKGFTNQHDDMYQVLKAMRPDFSDTDILKIITAEKIRTAEMALKSSSVDKILKENLKDYSPIKCSKTLTLENVIDNCEQGKIVVRIGSNIIVVDLDNKDIYTGMSELYTKRPVSAYWKKND